MAKSLQPVAWEAEEYIMKSHKAGWFVGLAVATIALGVLAVFLEGWTFLALIIVGAITILIYALRPPRKLKYRLDSKGLTEGEKLYPFGDYKAFGILKEDNHSSAVLIPKKRFGVQVKVYFPEGSGEQIVDFLGARLPMEEVKIDLLDKLVNFLRI